VVEVHPPPQDFKEREKKKKCVERKNRSLFLDMVRREFPTTPLSLKIAKPKQPSDFSQTFGPLAHLLDVKQNITTKLMSGLGRSATLTERTEWCWKKSHTFGSSTLSTIFFHPANIGSATNVLKARVLWAQKSH
jgi:hypothetical protein